MDEENPFSGPQNEYRFETEENTNVLRSPYGSNLTQFQYYEQEVQEEGMDLDLLDSVQLKKTVLREREEKAQFRRQHSEVLERCLHY